MVVLRIPVDFNRRMKDPEKGGWDRVWINTRHDEDLLQHLYPGLAVTLYEEHDIEVDATIGFDENDGYWFGQVDWTTLGGIGMNGDRRL